MDKNVGKDPHRLGSMSRAMTKRRRRELREIRKELQETGSNEPGARWKKD